MARPAMVNNRLRQVERPDEAPAVTERAKVAVHHVGVLRGNDRAVNRRLHHNGL